MPLPCIPAGMSHLCLLKGHAASKLFPPDIPIKVVTPKHTLACPRAAFVVCLSPFRFFLHYNCQHKSSKSSLIQTRNPVQHYEMGWKTQSQMHVCHSKAKQIEGRTPQALDLHHFYKMYVSTLPNICLVFWPHFLSALSLPRMSQAYQFNVSVLIFSSASPQKPLHERSLPVI